MDNQFPIGMVLNIKIQQHRMPRHKDPASEQQNKAAQIYFFTSFAEKKKLADAVQYMWERGWSLESAAKWKLKKHHGINQKYPCDDVVFSNEISCSGKRIEAYVAFRSYDETSA